MSEDVEIKKHLRLLGYKVQDRVTGFKGVVSSISFDLYGCVQALVTPPSKSGSDGDGCSRWLDVTRLIVKGRKPVMEVPNFVSGPVAEGKHGPADKPPQRQY